MRQGENQLKRILGLFAHPDDEIFCSGGTMARAASDGAEVLVVSFTRGEAGQIRDAALARRSTIGAVREAELGAACERLGVGESRCLDFADGTLAELDRAVLVDAAVEIIREFKPDTIISFDDSGAYGHPDHITMSEVSVEASQQAGCDDTPELGAPHVPDRVLHAQFPQSQRLLLDLLVDWLSGLPERFRGTETFVNALLMFADSSSMLGFAADHLSIEWFPRGSYIIEQDEVADRLYLLLSGSVDAVREGPDGTMTSLGSVGVGQFIGETGLASGERRNAHCIATENSACFVFSAAVDTNWKPRGASPNGAAGTSGNSVNDDHHADWRHDVADLVQQKIDALSAHRTQYTIEPGLFPADMLIELLGTEYFAEAWRAPSAEASPSRSGG